MIALHKIPEMCEVAIIVHNMTFGQKS